MKKFKQANEDLYEVSKQEKLAHDLALISEAGNDMCSIPLEKLKSKVLRDRHKKICVTPKKVNTKSIWSKAAQKAAGGRHKLYNSLEEGPDDNLVILIRDITSQMIGAIKKKDQKKLMGLYKNLGNVLS
jgi:hypothetical protein